MRWNIIFKTANHIYAIRIGSIDGDNHSQISVLVLNITLYELFLTMTFDSKDHDL